MGLTDNDSAVASMQVPGHHRLGRITGWLSLLAVVLTAAALAPGVAADYFFSDSYAYITYNDALRAIPLYEFWRVSEPPLFWRELLPLRDLVYRAEMAAFGLEPIPYKAINLLLLLLCGLAIWAFSSDFDRRFREGRTASAAPGIAATVTLILWIAHPSHVESVAWAAGLKDVLSGLLGLLSLYAFQKALPVPGETRRVRLRPLVIASLLFAAALMSKATVAPVAGMALLLAVAALSCPLPSGASLAKGVLAALPLLAIAAVAVTVQATLAEAGTRPALFAAIGDGRFERALRILGTMYQTTVIPYDLRLTWDVYEGGALGAIRFAFAVLAILGAIWGAWVFVMRRIPEGFGLAAAFGATVPVLHLIPFETWSLASERHLFWTLFGLALAAGFLAARVVSRRGQVLAMTALAVGAIAIACLGLTLQRSLEWFAGPEHLRIVENEADPSSGFGAVMRIEDDLRAERYDVAMKTAMRVENEAQRNMLKALVVAVQAIMQFSRERQSRSALVRADRMMLEAEAALRAVHESVSDPASVWLVYTMQRKLIPPYEGLIKLAPEQGAFRYNLALIKQNGLSQNERYEAEILFLQAIRTGRLPPSVSANAWSQIALVRMRSYNFSGARQALLASMAADPTGYRAAYLLAGLETKLGDLEAASNAARQYRIRATAAGMDPEELEARLKEIGRAQNLILQ
jgi:hypothetical protein